MLTGGAHALPALLIVCAPVRGAEGRPAEKKAPFLARRVALSTGLKVSWPRKGRAARRRSFLA